MSYPKTRLVLHFPHDKVRMLPLILTVLFLLPGWVTAEATNSRPFNAGDHFYYDIKWGFFKVGEAEMLIEEAGGDLSGELKYTLLVRTTSWADTFLQGTQPN